MVKNKFREYTQKSIPSIQSPSPTSDPLCPESTISSVLMTLKKPI